jgi:hypothetical protein
MTAHGNGLGKTFFDCTVSYTPSTTTRDAAVLAAKAFGDPAPTDTNLCGPFCVQGQASGACAIWCFGGSPSQGLVGTTGAPCSALTCPTTLTGLPWPTVVP